MWHRFDKGRGSNWKNLVIKLKCLKGSFIFQGELEKETKKKASILYMLASIYNLLGIASSFILKEILTLQKLF